MSHSRLNDALTGWSSDGLALTAGPVRLRGTALALAIIGLMILIIFGIMATAALAGLTKNPDSTGKLTVLVLGVIAVGGPATFFAAAWQYGWRRLRFLVAPDTLTLQSIGPLRRSQRQWPRFDVRGVVVEQTVSVNDGRKIDQLKLQLASEDLPLLAGRPRAELDHLAQALSDALAADAPATPISPILAAFPRPPEAKIHLYEDGQTFSFLVLAHGLRGGIGAFAAGSAAFLLFLVCGIGTLIVGAALDRKPADINALQLIQWLLYFAGAISSTVLSCHLAFRRAALVLTPQSIAYREGSPVCKREFAWQLADIQDVSVASSRDGKVVTHSLAITLQGRPKLLLDGRDPAELAWLAAIINHHRTAARSPAAGELQNG